MGWQCIRGHDDLIEGFRRVVQRGRMAHAYLFTGPEGVGKRLFAIELGRALLCESPTAGSLTACDHCPACLQIDAGTHPDFVTACRPPESHEFPIELMREVCGQFALKSARGRGKVVIIDDADDLNAESSNCFLKTLEEPPARSVLILIGTGRERQLSTIVSRCQVVRFAPLPEEVMRDLLAASDIKGPDCDRVMRLSDGSPGLALALADPELWTFRTTLLKGLTGRPIDSVGLSKKWIAFVEEAGKEAAARRRRAQLVVKLMMAFFDDVLTVALGGEARRTGKEDDQSIRGLATRLSPEQVLTVLDRCMEADIQNDRNVKVDLVLEALLDALAQQMAAA
jgi:DNA polymerase-3 subunit delta'